MSNEKPKYPNYKLGIQELEQDWYPNKPGMEVDARVKRIMRSTDTRQKNLIMNQEDIPKELPHPNFATVYAYKKRLWQTIGFKCMNCGKVMSEVSLLEKHPLVCTNALKINKEDAYNNQLEIDDDEEGEITMPIQRVMKGETPYYRYGTHGKLYRTKQEAEQQMRAMYAAGYKEKKDQKK